MTLSYRVTSYNIDSGWKVGEFLSHAATQAEAAAEAARNLGVEGLTQFRHVVDELGDVEAEAPKVEAEVETAANTVAEVAPVIDPEAEAVDKFVEKFKELDQSLLTKILAKLTGG